jgi:hypothetical protein
MRVSCKIMSPIPSLFVTLKTHMHIVMFLTTALKAFFKFSHSVEDEQKGKKSWLAVQIMSSSWYVSTVIVLEGKSCLKHWQDGAPHSIQILWWSQRFPCVWVDIVILKATLKAFSLLNNFNLVWALGFLYVSTWHSEFSVGFEGKQCTRISPSDPRKLWPWSLLVCRIAFCYSCVCLLSHFIVTGPGPVPCDNLQELDKWFIYFHFFQYFS